MAIWGCAWAWIWVLSNCTVGLLSGLSWLLERLSITFTSKGKREFVPRDQVSSWACRLRFIISTRSLVVSRNFLSIRIVLSFFYQPVSYFEKCLTWIWRLPFAVYGKRKVSIKRFSRKLGHNLCPKTVPCATPKCPPVSKWLNLPPGKRQTKNMKLYLLQNITAAITATSSKTAITGPTTAPADSDPLTGSVGDWDCVTTT